MSQLIMRWKNDNTAIKPLNLPEGVEVKSLPDFENGINIWLDIIKYMAKDVKELTLNYYNVCMLGYENFQEDKCHILTVDGIPAATITVICDYKKKEGYIHMVACKPDFRGKGLGNLLNDIALNVLKKEKMETAYLTTDEWRIPAIKTYLKVGFYPDLQGELDFKERWDEVFAVIERKNYE